MRTVARAFGHADRRGQRAVAAPAVGERAQDPRGARHVPGVRAPPAARRGALRHAARPHRAARPLRRCTSARTSAGSSSRASRSTRWTPLQWAAKGMVVSQYDKDDIEALGLVKMDILGLRMHSAISDDGASSRASGWARTPCPSRSRCRTTTRRSTRPSPSADTVGMFQLESQRPAQPRRAAAGAHLRGHHRRDLAVPPRPARGRDDHAVHPPPPRARAGRRAASRDGAGARGLLRRHHLPGAGAAGRPGGGRLRPGRGGLACAAR